MMNAEPLSLNMRVLRWTMMFWLAGWFVRTAYFMEYLFAYVVRYPVQYDFFPLFFQSPDVSISVYFLPLLALPAVLKPGRRRMIAAGFLLLACSLISLWHIDTYNDATYVTCFWVALWMVWVAFNLNRADEAFRSQACFMAQLIVGMIFFGAAVGKMTPEYSDGRAWSQMFLKQEHYMLGVWMSGFFTPEQIQGLSAWLSRGMIFAELLIGLLPLFPFRFGAIGASVLMIVMMPLTNTVLIFSVVGCLIGMLLGALRWRPRGKTQGAV